MKIASGPRDVGARSGKRLLRRVLAVFFLSAAAVCMYGLMDRDSPADVAVVLGNEVYSDGSVSPRLAARLDRGLALYLENRCATVIVSGGVGESGMDEATAMALYLEGKGVPRKSIVLDHNGVNTWETARFTRDYMKGRGLESAIVVSQYFHIARSELSLRLMGVAKVGTASPLYFEWADVCSAPRELAGLAWYLARSLCCA